MEITALQNELKKLYRVTLTYEFHKATYEKKMEALKEEYAGLLEETARLCDRSSDNRAKIAACIPEEAMEDLGKVTSKRRRKIRLLDHKMNLVSWFLPLLGEIPSVYAGELAGMTAENWNLRMPEEKIGCPTYTNIRSGFQRDVSCYITTAVCRSLGKPDDCHELTVLRKYRDSFLMADEEGRRIVSEYYNIAPTIVKRINRRQDADAIYYRIWNEYLSPCIFLAEQGENAACREKYTEMVRGLEAEYLYLKPCMEQSRISGK